jgi:type VI secretion system protein ImpA
VKLFKRTRDLAIAVKMCEALVKVEGFNGLRDGLGVLSGLLEQKWPQVHPQLDPSDNNDPTMRLNILTALTDSSQFLSRLRSVPITHSMAGNFSMREISWANGKTPVPEGVEAPKKDIVEAAFKGTPQEQLKELLQANEQAIALVKSADAQLTTVLGPGQGVNFDPLLKVLREIDMEVRQHVAGAQPVIAEDGNAGQQNQSVRGNGVSVPGTIQTPDDVRTAIDRICEYYDRFEPSSPLPLLLRRAQKLVGKGFLDIMRDVSPDSVKQVEALGGISEPSS